MPDTLTSLLLTFLAGGIGAYCGSYLKKKGENLATREDIAGLVEQVSAVTQATKAIEAEISTDMWDRQKQWELKKEAVFEAAKELASAQETLTALMSTCAATQRSEPPSETQAVANTNLRLQSYDDYRKADAAFKRAAMLTAISCGDTVRTAFNVVELQMARIAGEAIGDRPAEAFRMLPALVERISGLIQVIRSDLGVGPAPHASTK
jgi:hypothetical protein